MEPHRKKRWRRASSSDKIPFFTCARPGRSISRNLPIGDEIVHKWVRNLPGPNTAIVSLLGRKPDGKSEFSFYSFYGGLDLPTEYSGRLSFQNWLDRWHKDLSIQVVQHPTFDFRQIPHEVLVAVAVDIARLLAEGHTVVLVDSGGDTRTGQVCKHMGFIEDTRSP